MQKFLLAPLILISGIAIASAQSNKIVFGPLVGDDAGILTVRNGEAIGIELWVRTDPNNPTPIVGVAHGLLSEDVIIAERNGMDIEYPYDSWEQVWVDGPFDETTPGDFPIPPGYTAEVQWALFQWYPPPPPFDPLDTQGEWDFYGTWLMVTNTEIPIDQTYFPFMEGWYPHSGNGTFWAFSSPPGGGVVPEQSYCGLYFESNICSYAPGDCNHNGTPLQLGDVIAMINMYRGTVGPYYICDCSPHESDFAATADPNGNCIPNELNDVVTEIGAYRGNDTASGCPDCPGSDGLFMKQYGGQ